MKSPNSTLPYEIQILLSFDDKYPTVFYSLTNLGYPAGKTRYALKRLAEMGLIQKGIPLLFEELEDDLVHADGRQLKSSIYYQLTESGKQLRKQLESH